MKENHSTQSTVLEAQDLDSFYGDLQVLRKASLKLDQGETVALFGPNGHGKSTLRKVISGIHPPRRGSVQYFGQEIAGVPSDKIVDMGLAYIPEDRNLFAEMTVMENLRLGAYNHRARKVIKSNLQLVFDLFPILSTRKSQSASTLSGGEARMLAVGRGLMSAASVLLIDEPSIGLAPILKKAVFAAIGKIGDEIDISILVVEQEIDLLLRLSHRVYFLKQGQIIFEGYASGVEKEWIEKAYF